MLLAFSFHQLEFSEILFCHHCCNNAISDGSGKLHSGANPAIFQIVALLSDIAGGILTWARAFGLFGPLMIFVGSFRGRTEVLSTTIFLEQSVGNLEVALAVALLMILVAAVALIAIHLLKGHCEVKL